MVGSTRAGLSQADAPAGVDAAGGEVIGAGAGEVEIGDGVGVAVAFGAGLLAGCGADAVVRLTTGLECLTLTQPRPCAWDRGRRFLAGALKHAVRTTWRCSTAARRVAALLTPDVASSTRTVHTAKPESLSKCVTATEIGAVTRWLKPRRGKQW